MDQCGRCLEPGLLTGGEIGVVMTQRDRAGHAGTQVAVHGVGERAQHLCCRPGHGMLSAGGHQRHDQRSHREVELRRTITGVAPVDDYGAGRAEEHVARVQVEVNNALAGIRPRRHRVQIGRASCRERV